MVATSSILPDDLLLSRALIEDGCAEAAALLGDEAAAREHRQTAIGLHRVKGNIVSVARLQNVL
jgi:hypothetical protein